MAAPPAPVTRSRTAPINSEALLALRLFPPWPASLPLLSGSPDTMQICALLLAVSLLLHQDPPACSELEVDRICGYGTARCRRWCKSQERKISTCPNTYACCLKPWAHSSQNVKGQ
ncbi:beta-defensin 104A-like [Octodon degus]|uniref:Beta-defensin n=1 Tax=Octodon degus TaxID=10160 RepID=A0A6P6DFH7_OCTDE|nr:beta-defensin 104A-like [Octodon degus]